MLEMLNCCAEVLYFTLSRENRHVFLIWLSRAGEGVEGVLKTYEKLAAIMLVVSALVILTCICSRSPCGCIKIRQTQSLQQR